jgi:putative tryptophan/tyrosine transport system substrate-binding protein
MRRRDFIGFLGSAVMGWSLAARAQQSAHIPRIGVLGLGPASGFAAAIASLRQGLHDLGYIDGKNIVMEFRWTDSVDQLPILAAEFVRENVDIIFANSSTMVEPARQATKTIPIVFAVHADPVGMGHVASLAHPGGNITGLTMLLTDIAAKELDLLMQAAPQARRIGVLFNPTTPSHHLAVEAVESTGEKLKVDLVAVPASTADDFAGALSRISDKGAAALLVVASPVFAAGRVRLAELALKHRLPAMFSTRADAEAGGLMSYGADLNDLYRRSAVYIDKILKGAKPGDLPVEQATKYQFVINLKTAKALGVAIPPNVLALADEVIE